MTNRPRYRNFQKAYGGDPDTAVLRDLHKRLTKLEGLLWDLSIMVISQKAVIQVMVSPESINVAREKRIGGSEIPPPPQD